MIKMAGNVKELPDIITKQNSGQSVKLSSNWAEKRSAFQVVQIWCYLADKTYLDRHSISLQEKTVFLYDIDITDGEHKLRCQLHWTLGAWVQQLKIYPGCWIRVTELQVASQDRNKYLVITKFRLWRRPDHHFSNCANIPYIRDSHTTEDKNRPLTTAREYYLNVWFNRIPHNSIWTAKGPPIFDPAGCRPFYQPVSSIAEIADESCPYSWPYPQLVVVVVVISNLWHYGKHNYDRSFPFMMYLEVADNTGTCTVSIWEKEIIVKTYPYLQVGMPLFIYDYHVSRKLYQSTPPRVQFKDQDLPHFNNLELKVSRKRNIVSILPENSAFSNYVQNLPKPTYKFVQSKNLGNLKEGDIVDVAGVVTYVGRFERQKCIDKEGKLKNDYWVSRWVEMVDGTSVEPFRIVMYVNRQVDDHQNLCPGMVVVCTQLVYTPTHKESDVFYLTTTSYSELHLNHTDDKLYMRDQYQEVMQLVNLQQENKLSSVVLEKFYCMSGKYPVTLCDTSYSGLNEYLAKFGIESIQETTINELKKDILNLGFREVKQYYVKGFARRLSLVQNLSTDDDDADHHGWHYCSRLSKLKERVLLHGPRSTSKDIPYCLCAYLPVKFDVLSRDELLQWMSFPSETNTEQILPVNKELSDVQELCKDFYRIYISDEAESNDVLECVFAPHPSSPPHPTFQDLLSGNYSICKVVEDGFSYFPTHYRKEEIKAVKNSLDVSANSFLFVINVHRVNDHGFEISVCRAFLA